MELGSHEPGMVLDLYNLYQAVIRQGAGNDQAALGKGLTVLVVELIAVTVTLADFQLAIGFLPSARCPAGTP